MAGGVTVAHQWALKQRDYSGSSKEAQCNHMSPQRQKWKAQEASERGGRMQRRRGLTPETDWTHYCWKEATWEAQGKMWPIWQRRSLADS